MQKADAGLGVCEGTQLGSLVGNTCRLMAEGCQTYVAKSQRDNLILQQSQRICTPVHDVKLCQATCMQSRQVKQQQHKPDQHDKLTE